MNLEQKIKLYASTQNRDVELAREQIHDEANCKKIDPDYCVTKHLKRFFRERSKEDPCPLINDLTSQELISSMGLNVLTITPLEYKNVKLLNGEDVTLEWCESDLAKYKTSIAA